MPGNRVPWVVGGVLILLMVIGSGLSSSGGGESAGPVSPPESARAVVLPASEVRTVLVAPCNTPVSETARTAGGEAPPGATALQFPRGSGFHTLLVPHCQPSQTGATDAAGAFPSAAFVVPGTEGLVQDPEGKIIVDGIVAESQLIVFDGSSASTIVVPPCTEKQAGKGRDTVLGQGGRSGVVTAPAC